MVRQILGARGALMGLVVALGISGSTGVAAESAQILGKVKKIESAEQFQLKAARGGKTYTVSSNADAVKARLVKASFKDVSAGLTLYVLGRRQEPIRDPNSQLTQPAQIVQIQTVIVVDDPALLPAPKASAKQKANRLEWITGKLTETGAGFAIDEGGAKTDLQWGAGRAVLHVAKPDGAELKKGALLLCSGSATKEGRKYTLEASTVYVLSRGLAADLLAPLLN
ncbi:MAG: hypothetical protein ACYTFT_16550 [Planctomycetota bacterium]|jgi:hypothetical protein